MTDAQLPLDEARAAVALAGPDRLLRELADAARGVAGAREGGPAAPPNAPSSPLRMVASNLDDLARKVAAGNGRIGGRAGWLFSAATGKLHSATARYRGEPVEDWARDLCHALEALFDLASDGEPSGAPRDAWPYLPDLVDELVERADDTARPTALRPVRWIVAGNLYGATKRDVADLLGVHPSTLRRWLAGHQPSPANAVRAVALAEATRVLAYAFHPDQTLAWFRNPNPELDGRTPADLLHGDDRDRQRLIGLAEDTSDANRPWK